MAEPKIFGFRFTSATHNDRRTGLLGYISFVNGDGLRFDGITLRRTADGRLVISFPERTDANGKRHPIIRPVDTHSRIALERAILRRVADRLDGYTTCENQLH